MTSFESRVRQLRRRLRLRLYVAPRLAGAIVVVALGAALFGDRAWGALWIGSGLAALLLAVDVIGAPRPERLKLTRDVPDVVTVRAQDSIGLRISNPTARTLTVALHDATPPSLGRVPRRHVLTLPTGASAEARADIHPQRRGRMVLGPVTVRVSGRLGLGGRQSEIALPGSLRVFPALPGRRSVELRVDRARVLQTGERSTRLRGGGGEFDSLREYHPDDEFRRINWHATARAGKPITNLYREERNQQVTILVDSSRVMAGSVEGVARLEHAIDAAMAVAELATRIGDHVGMVAFDGDVRVRLGPRGGRRQAIAVLEALFALEPSLDAPDYRGVFAAVLRHRRRRGLLVLLTDLVDERLLDGLVRALPVLVRRHLVIVGAARDPTVEQRAAAGARTSGAAYLKAAAAEALERRETAARRLRGLGIDVVDAAPSQLAGSVADAYLRVKAHGRL